MEPNRGRARAQAPPLNTVVLTVLDPPPVPRLATQTLAQVCIPLLSFESVFSANEQKHECQRIDYYPHLINSFIKYYCLTPYRQYFSHITWLTFCISCVFRLYISSVFRLYISSAFHLYITSAFRLYIKRILSVYYICISSVYYICISSVYYIYISSVYYICISSAYFICISSVFRMEDNRESIRYFL